MSPVPPPGTDAVAGIAHALVVGLGTSGRAAARLLGSAGVVATIVDDDPRHPAADAARAEGLRVAVGASPLDRLDDTVGLVVPSPGVPEASPVLSAAADRGIPVWSEPELAMRLHPRRLLAVTGTNGKTSTTELVTAMLRAGGRPAVACGNIGRPLSEAAAQEPAETVLVAELSSFQLRFCHRLRPEVGALLNLAPDHLDWHPDLEAYAAAKARMWRNQQASDWAVANADDAATLACLSTAPGRTATFSARRAVPLGVGRRGDALVARIDGRDRRLIGLGELPGAPHHHANAAAAACVALLDGVAVEDVARALRAFRPGRHRYETVGADERGVTYVDDSKATNVAAAAAALAATDSIVWIAGGVTKGVDLMALAPELGNVHDAVLIGSATAELAGVCASVGVPAHRAESIECAVAMAARLAGPGDTVLLSPACASFDQFADYAERGDRFAAAVREIVGGRGGTR